MKIRNRKIPRPSSEEVVLHLKRWKEKYPNANDVRDHSPNTDVSVVEKKISEINTNERTRLSGAEIKGLANYIVNGIPDFGERLSNNDLTLVSQLATEHNTKHNEKSKKPRNLYSFSSKYCNLHNPNAFPKFDKLVSEVLRHFQYVYGFIPAVSQIDSNLDDYKIFVSVLDQFTDFFNLTDFTRSEIDHYLWFLGIDYFA